MRGARALGALGSKWIEEKKGLASLELKGWNLGVQNKICYGSGLPIYKSLTHLESFPAAPSPAWEAFLSLCHGFSVSSRCDCR